MQNYTFGPVVASREQHWKPLSLTSVHVRARTPAWGVVGGVQEEEE